MLTDTKLELLGLGSMETVDSAYYLQGGAAKGGEEDGCFT